MTERLETYCQNCSKPIKDKGYQSITQWVFGASKYCSCHDKGKEITATTSRKLCSVCLKPEPEESKAHGSLTQWVIRFDECSCRQLKTKAAPPLETSIDANSNFNQDLSLQNAIGLNDDRYLVVSKLGEGGYASVFLSYDQYLHKPVALKTISGDGWTQKKIVYFQKEARLLSKLNHPNIVSILDLGVTTNQQPYMVMERFEGTTLDALVSESGPLDEQTTASLLAQLSSALEYAHDRGILHCDLTPRNILCSMSDSEFHKVLIIDFGLSRLMLEDDNDAEMKPQPGSPLYMAPDTFLGRVYDTRSDLYALACIMFFVLTGHPPFEAGDTSIETIRRHAETEPRSLSDCNPEQEFGAELESFFEKALSKDPDQRFQSPRDFFDAYLEIISSGTDPTDKALAVMPPRVGSKDRKLAVNWILGTMACLVLFSFFFIKRFANEQNPQKEEEQVNMEDRWNVAAEIFDEHVVPAFATIASSDLNYLRKGGQILQEDPDLILTGSDATDADMVNLSQCKRLREIDLSRTQITEKSIPVIAKIGTLQRISLNGLSMPHGTMTKLSALRHLEELQLNNCQLTDVDLQDLQQIKSLKTIRLCGNESITTDGINKLDSLPKLELLDLRETDIPPESLEKLTQRGVKILTGTYS